MGIDPVRVGRVVFGAAAALSVAGLVAAVLAVHDAAPWHLTRLVNPDQKLNLPTGFKTTALLTTSLLLLLRGRLARRRGEPKASAWTWLAAGGAVAFLDETTYLHQSLGEVLADQTWTTGLMHFGWWIFYLPIAAVAAVLAVRFLLTLSPTLRVRLLGGGVLYGLGAVLSAPFKSTIASGEGQGTVAFALSAALSDAAQMLGLALLVTTLLTDLLRNAATVSFVARRTTRRRVVAAGDQAPEQPNQGTAQPAASEAFPVAPSPTKATPAGQPRPDAETVVVVTTTDPSPPAVVVLPDGATAQVRVPDVPETDGKDA